MMLKSNSVIPQWSANSGNQGLENPSNLIPQTSHKIISICFPFDLNQYFVVMKMLLAIAYNESHHLTADISIKKQIVHTLENLR